MCSYCEQEDIDPKTIRRGAKETIAEIAEIYDLMRANSSDKETLDAYFSALRQALAQLAISVADACMKYNVPGNSDEGVAVIADMDIVLALVGAPTFTEHLMNTNSYGR